MKKAKKKNRAAQRVRGKRRTRTVKPGAMDLSAPVTGAKLHRMKISDFYRPVKKPVTLRLDADVIAWFKKDGKRYQTRINIALRKVMEREMRAQS